MLIIKNMNIVENLQIYTESVLNTLPYRSQTSIDNGKASCETRYSPKQVPTHDEYPAYIQSLPLQTIQMDQEQLQLPIDMSLYLSKRKTIMSWLQQYSEQFNLTRSAAAAAHHFAQCYYHNEAYKQKCAKVTLTALLILASKQSDYKILFTNHIAYICQLNEKELKNKQLQCCVKMDFNLSIDTYVTVVDNMIEEIKIYSGLNLYMENEECYLKLRKVHKVVERLYTQNYEWRMNQQDILLVFEKVLEKQIEKNGKLEKLFTNLKLKYINYFLKSQQEEQRIPQLINQYIKQWDLNRLHKVRSLFIRRKQLQHYTSYDEFCIKYYYN